MGSEFVHATPESQSSLSLIHQPLEISLISLHPNLKHENHLPISFLTNGIPHCPKPLCSHLASHSLSQPPIFPKPPISFHTIKFSIFRPQVISFFCFIYPFIFFTQRHHFRQGTFCFSSTFCASFSMYLPNFLVLTTHQLSLPLCIYIYI